MVGMGRLACSPAYLHQQCSLPSKCWNFTRFQILLDEGLQLGEDGVVHDKLPLVHGDGLQGPGDLDKPVQLRHVLSSLVKHLTQHH